MKHDSSTRSLPWFRLYTSLTRDSRFRRKPLHFRWAWVSVLCIAARCTKRGWLFIDGDTMTCEDLADEAAISIEEATEAFDWLCDKEFIVSYRGSLRVAGWDESQFESDSSTKRVQKHRSKHKNVERPCNVSRNADESPPDNRVQSTDINTHTVPPRGGESARLVHHIEAKTGTSSLVWSGITHQKVRDLVAAYGVDEAIARFDKARRSDPQADTTLLISRAGTVTMPKRAPKDSTCPVCNGSRQLPDGSGPCNFCKEEA